MARIRLLALVLLAVTCSCSKVGDLDDKLQGEVKKTEVSGGNKPTVQVSMRAARAFAETLILEDGERRKVSDIKPITHARDTLMYVVNFSDNKGWVTIAGDKRVEPILSSSLTGYLDLERIGVEGIWYEDLLDRLHVLRSNPKIDTASNNYKRWYALESYARYREALLSKKELRYIPSFSGDDMDRDDNVCVGTITTLVADAKVDPLIQTKWGQSEGWANKMPSLVTPTEYGQTKCAPGCVAVAGGQLLYYLNSKYGKPAEAYTEGGIVGWSVDRDNRAYSYGWRGMSRDAFSQMALSLKDPKYPNGLDRVSTFLSYIGIKVDMSYGVESGAKVERLVDFMREEYGISSDLSDYSVTDVRIALDRGFPVPIVAYQERERSYKILFIKGSWVYKKGHIWLIDGYKHYSTQTTSYWTTNETYYKEPIYLDTDGVFRDRKDEVIDVPYWTQISESGSYAWRMNIGWDNSRGEDDVYYGVSSSVWSPRTGYDYQYNKQIIHNIKL